MGDKPEPLWLHAYSGRENGLMVIGSPDSIKGLAQQLLTAAAKVQQEKSTESWPPEIAVPQVIGPYTDVPDYSLSFHIQGATPLSQIVPLKRRALPAPLFLAITVCAVIGAVTVVRWVLAYPF